MTAAIPAKAFSKIREEIALTLYSIRDYMEIDDPRIMRWADELERLPRSEKFLGLASLRHLNGDMDGVERMFARAETAGSSEDEIISLRVPIYLNLGYPTKSLQLCREFSDVAKLNLGNSLPLALASGGVSICTSIVKAAAKAKIDLSHVPQFKQIEAIATAPHLAKIEDERYAEVLDLAGAVMRKYRLFWLETAPRFSYDPEMRCFGIRYRLDATLEVSNRLNDDFIELLVQSKLFSVPVTVSFVATRVPNLEAA